MEAKRLRPLLLKKIKIKRVDSAESTRCYFALLFFLTTLFAMTVDFKLVADR